MGFVLFGLVVLVAVGAVCVRCGMSAARVAILFVLGPVLAFLGLLAGAHIAPGTTGLEATGLFGGLILAWFLSGLRARQ